MSMGIIIASNIAFFFWLYLLWKNGRLRFSKLRPLFFFFVALLPIASLIKIQHWAKSGPLFAISFAGIASVYLVHFLQKTPKTSYDILKLVWFLLFLILRILSTLNIIDSYYQDLHIPLFLWVLCGYIKQRQKQFNTYPV